MLPTTACRPRYQHSGCTAPGQRWSYRDPSAARQQRGLCVQPCRAIGPQSAATCALEADGGRAGLGGRWSRGVRSGLSRGNGPCDPQPSHLRPQHNPQPAWVPAAGPAAAAAPLEPEPPGSAPTPLSALLKRLLIFSAPIATIVLSEPLLGLTTSLFVGQFSSSAELAALGPANIVISFSQYIFASIQIATLGMLGVRLRGDDKQGAQQVLSGALGLGMVVGTAACLALLLAPEALVRATGVCDLEVAAHACAFLRVRAAGQLAVVVSLVCQSAFLAQQDSVAPAAAALLGAALAVAGHAVLVGRFLGALRPGPASLGLHGAAIATTLGNLACAAALLTALSRRGSLRPLPQLPSASTVRALAATMAPLSVTYVCKNLCYITIQTTATSTLTVTALAAHQAIFSAWTFLSFWVAPVEQSILALVPAATTAQRRRSIMQAGVLLCILIGLLGGTTLCCLASFAPGLLTQDAALWPLVRQVALPALLTLIIVGVDVGASAVIIAAGDAGFVAKSFVLTLSVVTAFMWGVRRMGWGFSGVWGGMAVFLCMRALQSGVRAWRLYLRAPPDAEAEAAAVAVAPAPGR